MTSHKKRPVLYELVSRNPRPRPRPVSSAPEAPATPPPVVPRAEPPSELPEIKLRPPRGVRPTGPSRPAMESRLFGRRRFRLSLGWPHLVVLGVVAVVVIIFAIYKLAARGSAPPEEPKSRLNQVITTAPPSPATVEPPPPTPRPSPRPSGSGAATPKRPVVEPAPRPEEAAAPEPAAPKNPEPPVTSFAFKRGHAYVVVQHLGKLRGGQAAEEIRQYLVSKGIECVVRVNSADIEVVATQAFLVKQGDKAAADRERKNAEQLMERIRQLGKEYNLSGGYSFDKCYLRDF